MDIIKVEPDIYPDCQPVTLEEDDQVSEVEQDPASFTFVAMKQYGPTCKVETNSDDETHSGSSSSENEHDNIKKEDYSVSGTCGMGSEDKVFLKSCTIKTSETKRRKIETNKDPNIWFDWINRATDDDDDDDDDDDEDDGDDDDDESDNEEDCINESIHDSLSEQEMSEYEETVTDDYLCVDHGEDLSESQGHYVGMDGVTIWHKSAPCKDVRTEPHNTIVHVPQPRDRACKAQSEIETLTLFLDDNVLNILTISTNVCIERFCGKFGRDSDTRHTDIIEIRSVIGILYLMGTLKCSRKDIHKLWDNSRGNGLEFCYLAMSEKRFRFLLKCLRFDDIRDRSVRKEFDNLAPIREVFELMTNSFQVYYSASNYLTIDEQFLAFRGKCPFKLYTPKKLAKYGLKMFVLVDAKTAYTLNLELSAGSQPEGPCRQSNTPQNIVLRLASPVCGTVRNITGDSWFTSFLLAKQLLNELKLTYCGAICKNKKEIPKEFLSVKQRAEKTTLFGFEEDCTLASYCPKKNKTVLVLSTMHHDNACDEDTNENKIPKMITFYNRTKIGVDLLDRLCKKYNVARNTRRWPMVIFYNLLNIAAINAFCIFKANNEENTQKNIKRITFLENIAWELVKPQIKRRYEMPQTPGELKRRAKILLGIKEPLFVRTGTRGRCYDCGRSRDKTTRRWCCKCQKWACADHLKDVCLNCL